MVGRHLVRILSPDFSSGCLIGFWSVDCFCFGKLFHISTILCEKLYFLIFVLQFFLYIFWLWPLVAVWLIGKICSCCTDFIDVIQDFERIWDNSDCLEKKDLRSSMKTSHTVNQNNLLIKIYIKSRFAWEVSDRCVNCMGTEKFVAIFSMIKLFIILWFLSWFPW